MHSNSHTIDSRLQMSNSIINHVLVFQNSTFSCKSNFFFIVMVNCEWGNLRKKLTTTQNRFYII